MSARLRYTGSAAVHILSLITGIVATGDRKNTALEKNPKYTGIVEYKGIGICPHVY
jgi:hypothetical protein